MPRRSREQYGGPRSSPSEEGATYSRYIGRKIGSYWHSRKERLMERLSNRGGDQPHPG